MMEMVLDALNAKKGISGKLWRVCLSNGKSFNVLKEAVRRDGIIWPWKVDTQYFDTEEHAIQYLRKLIAEKLTGKRIIYHSKRKVPDICGVDGAACRHSGECNTALCMGCPVAEKFFADRDGVELIYAV